MKYFVELADDVRSPLHSAVVVRMGRVYPLDQLGKFTSDIGMELMVGVWQDESGYVVEIDTDDVLCGIK